MPSWQLETLARRHSPDKRGRELIPADSQTDLVARVSAPYAENVERQDLTDVTRVLSVLSAQTTAEIVNVRALNVEVLPGVLSPRYSHSCDFLIANWHIPAGSRVLDLGCGTGILGIAALNAGAESLVSIDCNRCAIENTRRNLERLGFSNRSLSLLSDGYTELATGETFDVILLNPPYWNRHASTDLERACFDENYRFLTDAITGAPGRLRSNGRLFLVFSDQGDVTVLAQLIEQSRLHIERFLLLRPTIQGGHIRLFYELQRKTTSEA